MVLFKKQATKILAGAILAGLSFGAFAENVPDSIPGTTLVDGVKLIEMLGDNENFIVIDARATDGRAKAGWIPGSVHVGFGKGFDGKVQSEKLKKVLGSDMSQPFAAFCNGVRCDRSTTAVNAAKKLGYTNIYWYRGGWDDWTANGYPVEK